MDRTRKPNLAGSEVAQQLQSRQADMGIEELREDKLTHLKMFVQSLEKTPAGGKELQQRLELFGECKRVEGESSGQFYGRLRFWLDRSLP
jgi:hypothetical protein